MKIVIIGGGAAGMMAACVAADNGADVTLIERNKLCGIKLNLTGKGRCNVTNDCDTQTLMRNTVCNGKFLYSAYAAFNAQDTMAFFEAAGVPLKTERGQRVFPASDNAKDISGSLKTCMKRRGVTVKCGRVRKILTENGSVCGVLLDNEALTADGVILATGGLSYPRTGSDGDGFKMATSLGHTVTKTSPSLVPLVAQGSIPEKLEGLSLKNVAINITKDKKSVYKDFGEMIFTQNGLSGPMILSASAHLGSVADFPYDLTIDLKPALDFATLDKRLLRDFEENLNRDFSNALVKLLPSKMIPTIIELSGIDGDKKVNSISRAQREALCSLLKALPFKIIGKGSFEDAVVTRGGIAVNEIDPKTMKSKLVKGLYFAGEIIDVDAYTGGFNLQIAWSTGACAGKHCALGDK